MAATEVNTANNTIALTAIDADWDMGAVRKIQSIVFTPGAANDELVVKDGAATAATICKLVCPTTAPQIWYGDGCSKQVFIDYSECTVSANHVVSINMAPARS